MALNDKQNKRLEALLKTFDQGAVQKEELMQVASAILDVVKQSQDSANDKMANNKGESETAMKSALQTLDDKVATLTKLIQDTDGNSRTFTASEMRALNELIEVVRGEIPELPDEFDPGDINKKLSEHFEMIASLTENSAGIKIREALEELKGEERLDVSAIKGLDEVIEKAIPVQHIPPDARTFVVDIDISSQLNGVDKTFNIQAIYNIISVDLSSFPYGSLRKNIDYTYTNTTITFTSEISASPQLNSGQSCILTVVTA